MHPLLNRTWKRPFGQKRALHVDVLILRPRWQPTWIWQLLDDVLPIANKTWDGDPTSPAPMVIALRTLEFTWLGPVVGHAFASVSLLDQALNLLLPFPIVHRRFQTYGFRWLGVSIYIAAKGSWLTEKDLEDLARIHKGP